MIKPLVDFGTTLRDKRKAAYRHDAFMRTRITMEIILKPDGTFVRINKLPADHPQTYAETILVKAGKARLLLDKPEEVLNMAQLYKDREKVSDKKHELFLEKLNEYKDVKALAPVFAFYEDKNKKGLTAAAAAYADIREAEKDDASVRTVNIGFRIMAGANGIEPLLNEHPDVVAAVKKHYEDFLASYPEKSCSVCGGTRYPVGDISHGKIMDFIGGQSSGMALVSYNKPAFESYGLQGNENAGICTHCASLYIEAMNYLIGNFREEKCVTKKGIEKTINVRTNCRNLGNSTNAIFWTKDESNAEELMDLIDRPGEESVRKLFSSLTTGVKKVHFDPNQFYFCIMSASGARIAVKDWQQKNLSDVKGNVISWFDESAIAVFDWDTRELKTKYFGIYQLATSCLNPKVKSGTVVDKIKESLWKSAIEHRSVPMPLLQRAVNRLGKSDPMYTPELMALLRVILNRIPGGKRMSEKLDVTNTSTAYLCGRILAILENVQYQAIGKRNASLASKNFKSVAMTPAMAIGRLMPKTEAHLKKLDASKPGIAIACRKELASLFGNIKDIPKVFRPIESAQFTLGFYHQMNERNERIERAKALKAAGNEIVDAEVIEDIDMEKEENE